MIPAISHNEDKFADVRQKMLEIRDHPKLSSDAKRRLAGFLREPIEQERARLDREISTNEKDRKWATNSIAAFEEIIDWYEGGESLSLERANGSLLHQVSEAIERGQLLCTTKIRDEQDAYDTWASIAISFCQIFVVEHDWFSALKNASDFNEGEFRLPYNWCCFEFVINGKRVIALIGQEEDSPEKRETMLFFRTKNGWLVNHSLDDTSTLLALIWNQIRAISITLDAEIVEKTIIRAPHKLNSQREKRGRLPLFDYHILNLSRRHRASRLEDPGEGGKVRLHFRRGHWRHYPNHKTWINWMLVGNPDLGFVDKEYRL